ncbi:Clavaminate synthase-like protein [Plenodomus tracheiphilus IPT5]|uniref:Clavaminate synthase-like protein n=1 Tax=Plenodomus tracheiphilus IPT5 TaxID=1408161 RepID=A0A6A7AZU0_9PLEO|nr:Clavaminate synthase-like protein [Plenodomus tracheiphilus IPT5]
MTEAADIAIVSFEKFITGNDVEKQAVAKELYNAFSTVGWVYLKDFGIPQIRVEEIFALAKTFFDLPLSTKAKWRLKDAELNQGYTGDGDEANGGIDHKESYEHRRFKNPACPNDAELVGFRKTMDAFYEQCYVLGMQVLKCLAIAMDLGDDFFTDITKQADPQLRILHYPSIEKKIIEQEGHARIIPHTDFGLCTLLFQDSVGGLEVDPFHTGDFKAALPVPGTVLINIADLLQRLTNDRCRSTMHRVVSPKAAGDILPSRYSIPFFIHPDPDAIIDPVIKDKDEIKRYEPVNAGEWRIFNTMRNYKMIPVTT